MGSWAKFGSPDLVDAIAEDLGYPGGVAEGVSRRPSLRIGEGLGFMRSGVRFISFPYLTLTKVCMPVLLAASTTSALRRSTPRCPLE